jgi:hypothetical protein
LFNERLGGDFGIEHGSRISTARNCDSGAMLSGAKTAFRERVCLKLCGRILGIKGYQRRCSR